MANEKRLIDLDATLKRLEKESWWLDSVCLVKRISVDKEELIRALQYDRDQYEKGYADAMDSIVRCENCVHRKEKVCCNPSAGMWVGVELKDSDFCSYGERKDND